MKKLSLNNIVIGILFVALIGGELLRFEIIPGSKGAILGIDIALIILNSFYFIKFIKEKTLFKKIKLLWTNQIWRIEIIFLLWTLLSLILNFGNYTITQSSVAIFYWIRLFLMFSVAWWIYLENYRHGRRLIQLFYGCAVAIIELGYLQLFFIPDFEFMARFGWDPHKFRLLSTFFDPNFLGIFIILIMLITLGYIFENGLKFSNTFSFVLLISWSGLFLTFSRSAWIAGALALVPFIWKYSKIFSLITLFVFVFALIIPNRLSERVISGTSVLDEKNYSSNYQNYSCSESDSACDPSGAARVISYKRGLDLVKKHWLVGVGYNAYGYALVKDGLYSSADLSSHSSQGSDNSLLNILATTGIVGFILFIWFGFALIIKVWKIWNQDPSSNWLAGVVFCFSIAWVAGSFFNNALFFPFLLVPISILIGLVLAQDKKQNE